MKKLVVFFVVLALFTASSAVYAGQFGPPEPAAKEGKASLGVGYFYSSAKVKPNNTTDWEEGKIKQNQVYLQLSYGIIKKWEAYLRAGGADLKMKNAITDTDLTNSGPKGFNDGLKFFGTLGIKGLIYENQSFGIGPFAQVTMYSSYEDEWTYSELGWSDNGTLKAKVKNPRDINLGVSAKIKIGEVILYAGPFAYWYKAKAEVNAQNLTTGASGSDSTTYKEKGNIGGFAGVRVPLGKGLSIEVEGQYKSEFSMGGALTYAF